VRVNVVTPPGGTGARVNAIGVPVGHSSLNAEAVTLTALLNTTVTVVLASTFVAVLAGVVLVTTGRLFTVIATLASAVFAPPVPVFPWSSAWIASVSAPV